MFLITFIVFFTATASARDYSEEELSNFPKLFHLDDYEQCLARKDGLYCLGVFDLTAEVHPNPTYELLKSYSDESYHHFNRTRIHRGYCVSSRCPQKTGTNASQRFESCVDERAQARTLRASINTLHYCRTHSDRYSKKPTTPGQLLFLQCVYAIVVINIIGTIYDIYTDDNPDKNKLLMAFSIPTNWRRLTTIQDGADPRITALTPINGARVIQLAITTFAHGYIYHYLSYITNPEVLEQRTEGMVAGFLTNGNAIIQGYVAVSCFLTGYNLLLLSQKQKLSLTMLPLFILKRVIRILPVNLLIVGFAMTWWMHTRDGPLVPTTIGLESRACHNKFWYQVLFINNLVDRTNYCVAPSWFLAADMQLYIIACTLTLIMWRRRSTALKVYSYLFIISCAVISTVVHVKEYKAMILYATPEGYRKLFRESPSFTDFYLSSWGSIPSCFLGLIAAHIQFESDERRIKLSDHKWFVYLQYCSFALLFVWPLAGSALRQYSHGYNSSIFLAVYSALERPVYCIIFCTTLLGIVNIKGPLNRFFGWRNWTTMARVSLTVMLLHWCVNHAIGSRPIAYSTSMLDIVVDWTATNAITYLLAIPITILVEIPMQKFLGSLLFE